MAVLLVSSSLLNTVHYKAYTFAQHFSYSKQFTNTNYSLAILCERQIRIILPTLYIMKLKEKHKVIFLPPYKVKLSKQGLQHETSILCSDYDTLNLILLFAN